MAYNARKASWNCIGCSHFMLLTSAACEPLPPLLSLTHVHLCLCVSNNPARLSSMFLYLGGCLQACISHDVLSDTQTCNCSQVSPMGSGSAVCSPSTDSKGGLIEDGCFLKKSLLMDTNLAPPFITTILFRLDSYKAVTWAADMCVCVSDIEDKGKKNCESQQKEGKTNQSKMRATSAGIKAKQGFKT